MKTPKSDKKNKRSGSTSGRRSASDVGHKSTSSSKGQTTPVRRVSAAAKRHAVNTGLSTTIYEGLKIKARVGDGLTENSIFTSEVCACLSASINIDCTPLLIYICLMYTKFRSTPRRLREARRETRSRLRRVRMMTRRTMAMTTRAKKARLMTRPMTIPMAVRRMTKYSIEKMPIQMIPAPATM